MFKVEGRSIEGENVVEDIAARKAKMIWDNPSNYGLTKVYKVTAISNRRERGESREAKYT